MVKLIGRAGIVISSWPKLVNVIVIVSEAKHLIYPLISVEHFECVKVNYGSLIKSSNLHSGCCTVNLISDFGVIMNSIFFYFVSIAKI